MSKTDKGTIYLFCGFGSPLSFYLPAILRFNRGGFSVVAFRFKTRAILGLSAETLPKAIDEVVQSVANLENTNSHEKTVAVIGNSMGSVFAWHTASKVPSINKVVANTGYALISRHIFEDKIGEHWRNKLIADGITEQAFHELILESEPATVISKVKNKKILIFLNRDDNVISFSNSLIYKKVLEDNGIPYEYVENSKMRHGTTIIKNLHGKRLLEFLKS